MMSTIPVMIAVRSDCNATFRSSGLSVDDDEKGVVSTKSRSKTSIWSRNCWSITPIWAAIGISIQSSTTRVRARCCTTNDPVLNKTNGNELLRKHVVEILVRVGVPNFSKKTTHVWSFGNRFFFALTDVR